MLPPEVVEETVDGGGIPCSEALDVRADFANKVIGGGILYHGKMGPRRCSCFGEGAAALLLLPSLWPSRDT